MVDIKSSDDLHNELTERLATNFEGKALRLDKNFGIKDQEIGIYPGDMLTIFGPTGCNKTALAQNIIFGYRADEDVIDPTLQIPTLFLSLELSGWYMQRRNLQIVSDSSKEDLKDANLDTIYAQCRDDMSHIVTQTIPPSITEIQQRVKEIGPACLVVDYVELLEPPKHVRGEYEQIKYACQQLRSIAVNLDIVVIMLSQVSREMSRSEALDIYAGKGSGAIENSSSHVMAINGQNKSIERRVEMLKSTDGELFEVDLQWTPSFRMRRKPDDNI